MLPVLKFFGTAEMAGNLVAVEGKLLTQVLIYRTNAGVHPQGVDCPFTIGF